MKQNTIYNSISCQTFHVNNFLTKRSCFFTRCSGDTVTIFAISENKKRACALFLLYPIYLFRNKFRRHGFRAPDCVFRFSEHESSSMHFLCVDLQKHGGQMPSYRGLPRFLGIRLHMNGVALLFCDRAAFQDLFERCRCRSVIEVERRLGIFHLRLDPRDGMPLTSFDLLPVIAEAIASFVVRIHDFAELFRIQLVAALFVHAVDQRCHGYPTVAIHVEMQIFGLMSKKKTEIFGQIGLLFHHTVSFPDKNKPPSASRRGK